MKSKPFFLPSAVSSFFEICNKDEEGMSISDPLLIGARGGGFRISSGNTTVAEVLNSSSTDEVYINGIKVPAKTTLKTIQLMRQRYGFNGYVRVWHTIEAPIGCGFGTSAAGSIGTALALADALGLDLPIPSLGQIAHVAEILCLTGLGTVIALVADGGAVGLVTEPGAPRVGEIEMLPADVFLQRNLTPPSQETARSVRRRAA